MKTAEEILLAEKCGDIFSNPITSMVIKEYRDLMKIYHPDINKNPNASDIAAKLTMHYKNALDNIKRGTWEESNVITYRTTDHRMYTSHYLRQVPFEAGVSYIHEGSLTYEFSEKYSKLFENAVRQIKSLRYKRPEIQKEFSRYMPDIRHELQTIDRKYILVISKPSDIYRLTDIKNYYGGVLPDRHVAWIISRLCNLCCFFEYVGIAHNGLTFDNCFISPQAHKVYPLGGWQYARDLGGKLIGMPRCIYEIMPVKEKSDKISSIKTDLESVKLIGRQLMDPSITPKPILSFLNSGSSGSAKEEFEKWDKALTDAYGGRKFVDMKIDKSKFYT